MSKVLRQVCNVSMTSSETTWNEDSTCWSKYYSYHYIIYPMFSHHWIFSSLNMESIPSLFFFFINCLYNISSFLLFQVSAKVVPRKLACLDNSYLPQKRRKKCPKWAKDRIFLEFIENFGHWFFLNLFTLFALLLHESYIWEKYIYFLRYGLKCSQPIKLQDF